MFDVRVTRTLTNPTKLYGSTLPLSLLIVFGVTLGYRITSWVRVRYRVRFRN